MRKLSCSLLIFNLLIVSGCQYSEESNINRYKQEELREKEKDFKMIVRQWLEEGKPFNGKPVFSENVTLPYYHGDFDIDIISYQKKDKIIHVSTDIEEDYINTKTGSESGARGNYEFYLTNRDGILKIKDIKEKVAPGHSILHSEIEERSKNPKVMNILQDLEENTQ